MLAELGEDAKSLAGGQSLVPMMNLRLARPSDLVDITRIAGLSYLQAGPDGLRIGALTMHRMVETTRDPAVLGGFGSIPGAVMGGIIIGLIELYAGATLPEGFKDTAPYIVLLLMLIVRPQGLFGTLARKKV